MKHFIKCILLLTVILFSGCTGSERVRVDIDKFIKDQASYSDKDVVITATLKDVVSRYDLYRGKTVEISAPFSYFGTQGFWTWHILLQEDDTTLYCYTHFYRIQPSTAAVDLLKRAQCKKEAITILGLISKDGLDIEEIFYDGIFVKPDRFINKGRHNRPR
jgi:hypothetical protein